MEEPLDDHLFEKYLKGRLQNYEEDPAADAWDNIFEAINAEDTVPVGKTSWFSNKWWMLIALLLWMVPGVIQEEWQVPVSGKLESTTTNNVQPQVSGINPSALGNKEDKSAYTLGEKNNESKAGLPLVDKKDINYTYSKKTFPEKARNTFETQNKLPANRLTRQQPTKITNTMPKDNSPERTRRKRTSRNTPKISVPKTVINKVVIKQNAQSDTRKTYQIVGKLTKPRLEYMNYSLTSTEFVPVKQPVVKSKRAKNLYAKLFVSPTYNYRRLLTNKEDNVVIQEVEKNSFFSGSNLGYSAGLMLESQLSKRWSVQWGISFTQLNDVVNYSYRNVLPDSVSIDFISANEIKVSPVFNTETSRFQYQYQDIGVQLGVNYALFVQSWRHQLYLGIAANKATKTISTTDQTTITENTSRFQSLLNIGYEARFQFNNRLGFYLKPTLNYHLNSINQANEAYQVKPFFTALRLGLVWRLR